MVKFEPPNFHLLFVKIPRAIDSLPFLFRERGENISTLDTKTFSQFHVFTKEPKWSDKGVLETTLMLASGKPKLLHVYSPYNRYHFQFFPLNSKFNIKMEYHFTFFDRRNNVVNCDLKERFVNFGDVSSYANTSGVRSTVSW